MHDVLKCRMILARSAGEEMAEMAACRRVLRGAFAMPCCQTIRLRNDGLRPSRPREIRDRAAHRLPPSGFDLMLVDIFMPHMRGFEWIRISTSARRLSRWSRCRIRLCQPRFAGAGFLCMALEFGATRCLRKPFTPGRCSRSLTNVLPKRVPASAAPFIEPATEVLLPTGARADASGLRHPFVRIAAGSGKIYLP